MTLILGLGNKARHGKDTFAAAIEAYYATQYYAAVKHGLRGYKPVIVQKIAFADALYREVNEWLGTTSGQRFIHNGTQRVFEDINVPDWVVPTQNAEKSARAPYGKHALLLQWWGTEHRRSQDQNYWVKQWIASINPKANIVLATDMRFFNEAAAVKSVGGFTVHVSRKNIDGTNFIDPTREANHLSEIQLDGHNYDYEITVKTGDQMLLEEWAITLVHYLRALKGHK
jgi:hypothetical protein